MSLRQRAKDRKRQRIFTASRRLFSAQGFSKTTIRQIARKAGVGTGTVFLYAEDKQALLAMIFCQDVTLVQEQAVESLDTERPFLEQLMHLLSAFYRYYGEVPELSRVFLKELLFSSNRLPEVRTATETFLAEFARIVSRAQGRGEVRADVTPAEISGVLFSVYWASLIAWLGGAIPTVDVAIARLESAISLTLAGLASRSASEKEVQK